MSLPECLVVDEFVLVRWSQMTVEGIDHVDKLVTEAALTKSPVYVGMVGDTSVMPQEAARKRLSDGLENMAKVCGSVNLVLDGTGIRFAAMRSGAAALFLLKGSRTMKMYNDLADCLAERAPDRRDAILEKARAAGVWVPKAPR